MDGKKNGKGKWEKITEVEETDSEGNVVKKSAVSYYDGEYKNDLKHGFGEYKWATGNFYKGQYQFDKRHGYGEMFWVDGSEYKGDWVDGI